MRRFIVDAIYDSSVFWRETISLLKFSGCHTLDGLLGS